MIDSVRDHEYILIDAAYDSSHIYDYVFENTHSIPAIDTNKRKGIVENNPAFNRKNGINIRKSEKSRYRLRWEIERNFLYSGRDTALLEYLSITVIGIMMLLLVK